MIGTSSLSDTRLATVVEKLAAKSTVVSFISIFIAVFAIGLSTYSIYSTNITTEENQKLYQQQLQKLDEIKNILSSNSTNKSVKQTD